MLKRAMKCWLQFSALLFLVSVLCTGCSSNQPPARRTADEEPLAKVGLADRDASRALHRGPKSFKELEPYLKKHGDPKQLLVSPNDAQPYQINWGLVPMRPSRTVRAHPIVVHEQTGTDGKRCVLEVMLRVRRLTNQEFDRLQGSSSSSPQRANDIRVCL